MRYNKVLAFSCVFTAVIASGVYAVDKLNNSDNGGKSVASTGTVSGKANVPESELVGEGAVLSADETDKTNNVVRGLYAQKQPFDDGPPPPDFPPPVQPDSLFSRRGFDEKSAVKFRLLVMYELIDHLGLDEETANKFMPLYLSFTAEGDSLRKRQRELTHKISDDIQDESVPTEKLLAGIRELKSIDRKTMESVDRFHENARKILDERQYVKLYVFRDRFKFNLMRRFRDMQKEDNKEMSERPPGNSNR